MRVVIVAADDVEAGQLAGALRTGGHDVRTAKDDKSLSPVLAEHAPELAIVSAPQAVDGTIGLVQSLHEAKCRPHVMLLHGGLPDDFVVRALDAGADADLKRPLTPKYLAARLGAVQRRLAVPPPARASLRPVARGTVAPVAHPATVLPPTSLTPVEVAGRSTTWTTAIPQLESAANKFLTLPVSVQELPDSLPPLAVGASILLLNAEGQLELRIAMAADVASARSLAVHLFGPDGEDLAADVMTELANILMGTLKTSFSGETLPFTGGLPEAIPVEQVLRPAMPYKFQESVQFSIAEARLIVHLGLRSRANILVQATRLREGMVVAKDVFNARGMLLLNGGTRLSEHMVERIRLALPAQHNVEVIAP